MDPVIDYLRKDSIGQITVEAKDCYFIMQPFFFYKRIDPWPEALYRKVEVRYEENQRGNGWRIMPPKPEIK